jgi:hypothetical protein
MARYYFHVQDGRTTFDDEGMDFPSLDAVRAAAVTYSGELLRDGADAALFTGHPWRLWVTDEPEGKGNTVCDLHFSASRSAGKP